MKAEIIAVGTEILVGDIVNTNAQFLSKELFSLGIDMYYQTVVGDNPGRLKQAISQAFSRADLVIFSGGLGPTEDDLTKETVADYFGLSLNYHADIMAKIEGYLKKKVPDSNKKQAMIPENALILDNECGTAPGIIIEKDEKIAVLLPGPPKELCPMFTNKVKPYLEAKSDFVMESLTLRLFGIGEAMVGEMLKDLMASANPTVAPYAKDNEVTLRIAAKAENKEKALAAIEGPRREIMARLGDYVYGEGEEGLPYAVGKLLIEKNLTISCVESCTGGRLTAALCDVPGISAVLGESIVTYANEAKIKYVGVLPETLQRVGAVSEETAYEMANGLFLKTGATVCVSVTGIAGPGGGTKEKPVGLCYVGVCYEGKVTVKKLLLHGTRDKIRHGAVMHALSEVRKRILAG